MSETMFKGKRQAKTAQSFSGGVVPYLAPCVVSELDVELESDLLGGSIVYRTFVETVGQVNNGYYEEGEIVSDANVWFD